MTNRFALFFAVLIVGARPAAAQSADPAATDGPTPVFSSRVNLVALNVTVTDTRARPVGRLAAGDFKVLDDGVPQPVSLFSAGEVPLDVALLIDSSASMTDGMPLVRTAASRFVETLRPGDRAQVVGFDERVRVLQDWTGDRQQWLDAIANVKPNGSTSLYNAIYVTLRGFSQPVNAPSDQVRRRAIVLLSDGEDTSSLMSFEDVLEACQRHGVSVYTIRLRHEWEADPRMALMQPSAGTAPDYALQRLARETGARAFTLTRARDLAGAYGSIAEELSSQYVIAYVPPPAGGRQFRRVQVLVPGRNDVVPRTRAGYYAEPTQAGNAANGALH